MTLASPLIGVFDELFLLERSIPILVADFCENLLVSRFLEGDFFMKTGDYGPGNLGFLGVIQGDIFLGSCFVRFYVESLLDS